MKKDEEQVRTRNKVSALVEEGYPDEEIARELCLEIGSRYSRKTVRWYKSCLIAKQNQKKPLKSMAVPFTAMREKPHKESIRGLGVRLERNMALLPERNALNK